MKYPKKDIREKLLRIYKKHHRLHKSNPDSLQMCCMWSTTDPPDFIDDSPPFFDIETVFNISIDEDDCLELYDMDLDEAVAKIANIIIKQC